MTDLISQLADAIVALNNASPRLPTKAEIEEVLQGMLKDAIRPANEIALAKQWSQLFLRADSPGTEGDAEAGGLTSLMAQPLQWHWVPETLRAAQAAWRPCPGSTDGSHHWYPATSRTPNGAFRCACGARKPA